MLFLYFALNISGVNSKTDDAFIILSVSQYIGYSIMSVAGNAVVADIEKDKDKDERYIIDNKSEYFIAAIIYLTYIAVKIIGGKAEIDEFIMVAGYVCLPIAIKNYSIWSAIASKRSEERSIEILTFSMSIVVFFAYFILNELKYAKIQFAIMAPIFAKNFAAITYGMMNKYSSSVSKKIIKVKYKNHKQITIASLIVKSEGIFERMFIAGISEGMVSIYSLANMAATALSNVINKYIVYPSYFAASKINMKIRLYILMIISIFSIVMYLVLHKQIYDVVFSRIKMNNGIEIMVVFYVIMMGIIFSISQYVVLSIYKKDKTQMLATITLKVFFIGMVIKYLSAQIKLEAFLIACLTIGAIEIILQIKLKGEK